MKFLQVKISNKLSKRMATYRKLGKTTNKKLVRVALRRELGVN